MIRVRMRGVVGLTLSVVVLFCIDASAISSRSALGATIPNRKMKVLGGGEHKLLGKDTVSVVLFFRSKHEFSDHALAACAAVMKELAGKPVHWVTVVSSREAAKPVRAAIKRAALDVPILVDRGDKLYAEMQVKVRPTLAIIDKSNKLVQWQPFRKINLQTRIRARILLVLGEITPAEMDKLIHPDKHKSTTEHGRALRLYNFAKMLLKLKKYDKAEAMISKSIESDPTAAASHALLGEIYVERKDCKRAIPAFDKALAIDPKEPTALAGKKRCKG